MFVLQSLRARTTLVGFAAALLALGGQALPAAAALEHKTFHFTISADNDVTNFVPCPTGTPSTIMLCGYGVDEPVTSASNDGGDPGLSGTNIRESFVSALEFPAPTPTCAMALKNYSAVTIKTTRGALFLVTHDGSYCAATNSDVEPFTIVGGTGAYAGATGSGVITAHATKPQTATQGFASEIYTGTLTLSSH
jgi:hypothetical protein